MKSENQECRLALMVNGLLQRCYALLIHKTLSILLTPGD